MAQLEIRLFGGLHISRDGKVLPPPTPQRTALLSYLLIFGERRQARHLLAGLFWGEHTEDRARRNLSDALYHLRQLLDPPHTDESHSLFLVDATHIGLNPAADVVVDVRSFLQLAQPSAPVA